MKKQSFVFGAVLLSLSGILCKILGAIYKIPLANVLGTQGMGIYYLIFPIYAFLLTFVSNSFVVSISKSVSQSVAHNDNLRAYKIFKASLILLLILGCLLSVVLCALSKIIAKLQGVDNSYLCYIAISPAIISVAISSAFKGFFQGLQNMRPSALSQIIDQLFKLSIGFTLAKILSKKGIMYATLGALLGVTIAEIVTMTYFVIYYLYFKKRNKNFFTVNIKEQVQNQNNIENKTNSNPKKKNKGLFKIMKEVLIGAFPFMLSSVILPMSLVIDSFLIINILKSQGFEKVFATGLLGINSGIVNTLINLPSTLSIAICMTIVPYITYSLSKRDFKSISQKVSLAIKLNFIISLPCVFVFAIYAPSIVRILYSMNSVYELQLAGSLLAISSINVLYLSFLQISTSLLQAINKAYIPVVSLSISLIFKIIFEIGLISIPSLNIAGAVISNAVCYFISTAINFYYFRKYINIKTNIVRSFLYPLFSSLIMSLTIYLSIKILQNFVSYLLCNLLSLFFGAVVYFIFLFLFKTFTQEEKSSLFKFKSKRT